MRRFPRFRKHETRMSTSRSQHEAGPEPKPRWMLISLDESPDREVWRCAREDCPRVASGVGADSIAGDEVTAPP